MALQELIDNLIQDPNKKITINGETKSIAGFAEFKSANIPDESYFKLSFNDHSVLVIIPSQNALFFSNEAPIEFKEIADEEIGVKKELTFRGKNYILDNANDYQYVIRLIKGDWKVIEGEVKFSDYVPSDGSDELLSLGWIVKTGKRADVNPKGISIQDISIN
jgi:hypothetical protein